VTEPLVLALISAGRNAGAIAAGFEEEGVPLTVVIADGDAEGLARAAARKALLGIGIGGDEEEFVLMLTGSAARPYLRAPAAAARAFGRDAARVVARRPLAPDTTCSGAQ
jgi:hypothetical protein